MTRFDRIALVFVALFCAGILFCPFGYGQYGFRRTSAVQGPKVIKNRPNIVLFCVDALGFSDLGCYGSEIFTPNLDKLAAEGLRFTQFYNCGQSVSSRASLLTGQYPQMAGLGHSLDDVRLPGYQGNLNHAAPTIAQILQENGYQTIMTGRWGLSKYLGEKGPMHSWPNSCGFDQFYGTLALSGNYFNPLTLMLNELRTSPTAGEFYLTEATGNMAATFLDEAAHVEKPIFLYVSLPAPLWPLQAPENELKSYRNKYASGWDAVRQNRYDNLKTKFLIGPGTQLSDRDAQVCNWSAAGAFQAWQSKRMEVYAAQVTAMDRAVGTVMDKMAQIGRDKDTLYIFVSASGASSDEIPEDFKDPVYMSEKTRKKVPVLVGNNPKIVPGSERTYQSYGTPWANVSNTPFRGYARQTYEGSISSPCIVKFPGIKAVGRITHQPAHVIDVLPTILEILELEFPKSVAGVKTIPAVGMSFAPVFQMKTYDRGVLAWEYEGNLALRHDKWKLVSEWSAEGESQRAWQLYDLSLDRSETKNLLQQYPSMAKELFQNYRTWAKSNQVKTWGEVIDAWQEVERMKAEARGQKRE